MSETLLAKLRAMQAQEVVVSPLSEQATRRLIRSDLDSRYSLRVRGDVVFVGFVEWPDFKCKPRGNPQKLRTVGYDEVGYDEVGYDEVGYDEVGF